MEEIIKCICQSIKDLGEFFKADSNSPSDKAIRKCNILIILCISFILIYSCIQFSSIGKRIYPNTNNNVIQNTNPHCNVAIYVPTNTISLINSTNDLPTTEFLTGEIVGIKIFGIFGVVTEKTLYYSGYKYTVRWKDNNGGLPKEEFSFHELYRPDKNSVPMSFIRN